MTRVAEPVLRSQKLFWYRFWPLWWLAPCLLMDPLIRRVACIQVRKSDHHFLLKKEEERGLRANANSCNRDYAVLIRHAAVVQRFLET